VSWNVDFFVFQVCWILGWKFRSALIFFGQIGMMFGSGRDRSIAGSICRWLQEGLKCCNLKNMLNVLLLFVLCRGRDSDDAWLWCNILRLLAALLVVDGMPCLKPSLLCNHVSV
jgi:hypothetical protein